MIGSALARCEAITVCWRDDRATPRCSYTKTTFVAGAWLCSIHRGVVQRGRRVRLFRDDPKISTPGFSGSQTNGWSQGTVRPEMRVENRESRPHEISTGSSAQGDASGAWTSGPSQGNQAWK